MPFLMSVESACERIISAIVARKRETIFPRRLYCMLAISKFFPSYWFNKMVSKYEVE